MSAHRTFAAAFFATVVVVVPVAWHGVDATIDKDGKRVRPLQQEITIDGARVTIDVDHNLIHTGDAVTAKLRAYSNTPKRVAIDLTVMRSNDSFGSRVASPPKAIDKEHFTLEATPDGGKLVETRLVMAPTGSGNKLDWFRIYVTPRGKQIDVFGDDDGVSKTAAAIGVLGWTNDDFAISIRPHGKPTAGEPFEVSVRVENTSGHVLEHTPTIQLGTSIGLYGIETPEDAFTIEDAADDAADDSFGKKFPRGAVKIEKFTVTPKHGDLKDVTFVASAYVWDDEPGPISQGALDARTVQLAPAEVAKQ